MKSKALYYFDRFCRYSAGYLMMFLILFGGIFLFATRTNISNLSKINYTERFVDSKDYPVTIWDYYSVNPTTELFCYLDAVETNTVMEFLTKDTFVDVYVDDCLMYADSRPTNEYTGISNGLSWKRVVIPPSPSKTTIKLVCTPAYNDNFCSISHCYIGNPDSVVYEIACEHFPAFLFSFFFIALGVISIVLFFYYQIRHKNGQAFLYVGYTSVITALWTMLDTTMPSYFFGRSAFWTTLSFVILLMVPLSIGLICIFRFTGKQKFYANIYIFISEFHFLICCFLHFSGILEFHYTRWVTIFLIVLAMPLFFLMLFTYDHETDQYDNHIMLVSLGVTVFACTSMGLFRYVKGYVYNTSYLVRTSIICFQSCLIGYHFKNTVKILREKIESKIQHEFQILDPVTGLFNRTALIEKRPNYVNSEGKAQVAILCFYLNNLQTITKEYGFEAAMQIIIDFSSGLHYAFPESDCYKIDHQKFLVIIKSDYLNQIYRQGMSNLESYCEEFNGFRNHPYKMEYSYAYEHDTSVGLFEIIDRLDEKMCLSKK